MAFGFPKPVRGTALLASRKRTAARFQKEQEAMRDAKKRDGYRCRRPNCRHRNLPIDPCHSKHRGMGGNPLGDRTKRELLVSLCRWDHGAWDRHEFDFRPQTADLFDGPIDYYEEGQRRGRETSIGQWAASGRRRPAAASEAGAQQ